METLLSQLHISVNTLRPISREPGGRSLSQPRAANRMADTTEYFFEAGPPLGSSHDRLICGFSQHSNSLRICDMEPRPQGSLDQRILEELVDSPRPALADPTLEPDPVDTSPIELPSTASDIDNSRLAIS